MTSVEEQKIYKAISDPTRRQIIDYLSTHEMNLTLLSNKFSVSRQAIKKHVEVLKEANMVTEKLSGRDHWLTLDPRPLKTVESWTSHYSKLWGNALNELGKYLDKGDKNE